MKNDTRNTRPHKLSLIILMILTLGWSWSSPCSAEIINIATQRGVAHQALRLGNPQGEIIFALPGLSLMPNSYEAIFDQTMLKKYDIWVMNYRGHSNQYFQSKIENFEYKNDELFSNILNDDIDIHLAYIQKNRPNTKVNFLGYSFGGLLVTMYLQGLVLTPQADYIFIDPTKKETRLELVGKVLLLGADYEVTKITPMAVSMGKFNKLKYQTLELMKVPTVIAISDPMVLMIAPLKNFSYKLSVPYLAGHSRFMANFELMATVESMVKNFDYECLSIIGGNNDIIIPNPNRSDMKIIPGANHFKLFFQAKSLGVTRIIDEFFATEAVTYY